MEFLLLAVVCLGFLSISDGYMCNSAYEWAPYENCLGYYQCDHTGVAAEMDCPAGLRISIEHRVCVWPDSQWDDCQGQGKIF